MKTVPYFLLLLCLVIAHESEKEHSHITVCCGEKHILRLINKTNAHCLPTEKEFIPTFHDRNGNSLHKRKEEYEIIESFPHCSLTFTLDPTLSTDEKFYVLENGHVYIPGLDHEAGDGQYCLLRRQDSDDSAIITAALVCVVGGTDLTHIYLTIYAVLMTVSCVFLLATFLVYVFLPQLRDTQGYSVMCAISGLFFGNIFLMVLQHTRMEADSTECWLIAVLCYFCLLATFFWLNIISFHAWHTTRPGGQPFKISFWHYLLYGYGSPLIFLTVVLILQFSPDIPAHIVTPGIGHARCWFMGNKEALAYFYGPVSVILAMNLGFFILTGINLYRVAKAATEKEKISYKLYLKLFVIMGLTWFFEIISWQVMSNSKLSLWFILLDLLNLLQGVLIFYVIVCRKRVFVLLKQRFGIGQWQPDNSDMEQTIDQEQPQ